MYVSKEVDWECKAKRGRAPATADDFFSFSLSRFILPVCCVGMQVWRYEDMEVLHGGAAWRCRYGQQLLKGLHTMRYDGW